MPRLAIIGLGLIGGSIGLALKAAKVNDLEVVGHDSEWGVGGRAKKAGAIDRDERLPEDAAAGAAIVVLAVPLSQIKQTLRDITPALGEGAVVTDTASTKAEVLRWAAEILPPHVSFVAGHPIAGKETSGIDAAEATLFQERPWAIIPSVNATENAVRAVENLVRIVGAKPVIIDADEHDSYLAAVSHLPLLAAAALFSLAGDSRAWPELGSLAGPGFRDTTRLASTNPDMSHDISLTNQQNLLHWLDRYIEELRKYRELVANTGGQEELYKQLAKVQTQRDAFLEQPPERPRGESQEKVSSADAMMRFMVGEYAMRRIKQAENIIDQAERRAESSKKDI